MSNEASDVADWFLAHIDRSAGDVLTHLRLQKLVYYAQAWHLAQTEDAIFDEEIQAWAHGPVVPSLFEKYREFKFNPIPAPDTIPVFDDTTERVLESVLEVYGEHSAKALERMTHRELPWIEARSGLPPEARSNAVIPKKRMLSFYKEAAEAE